MCCGCNEHFVIPGHAASNLSFITLWLKVFPPLKGFISLGCYFNLLFNLIYDSVDLKQICISLFKLYPIT